MATIKFDLQDTASDGLEKLKGALEDVGDAGEKASHQAQEMSEEIDRQAITVTKSQRAMYESATGLYGVLFKLPTALRFYIAGLDDLAISLGIIQQAEGEVQRQRGTSLLQLTAITAGVVAVIRVNSSLADSLKEVRDSTEKATDDFGRLENAAAGAGYNLLRPFKEVGPAASSLMESVASDVGGWFQNIGKSAYDYLGMKDAVDYSVKNLEGWETFFENWIDQARGNFVRFEHDARKSLGLTVDRQDQIDNYAEEAKALRELSEWHEKMDAQRAKEKDGFVEIKRVNDQYEESLKRRQRQEEISKLTNDEMVQSAIFGARRRASEDAAAGKDAKEVGERLAKELEMLEQQRTKNHASQTQERVRAEREAGVEIAKVYQSLAQERSRQESQSAEAEARAGGAGSREIHETRMAQIDAEAEARYSSAKNAEELIVIEAEAEKKRITEVETYRREQLKESAEQRAKQDEWLQANADASNEIAKARAEFADAMELHSLELKLSSGRKSAEMTKQQAEQERIRALAVASEIHEKKLELIERETERAISSAKTREDELKAVQEGEIRRARQLADFEKQAATESHNHKQKLADDEQRRKDERDKKIVEALNPMAQSMLANQSGRDRLKALQDKRGSEAAQQYRKDNETQFQQGLDDPSIMRKFRKNQQDAIDAARRRATQDARGGRVGADEQAAVANQVAEKQLQTMSKNGSLSKEQVALQKQALTLATQQQADIGTLQTQVAEMRRAYTEAQNANQQSANRRKAQGNAL